MTNEQIKINEAFENHLNSYLFEARDNIASQFGEETLHSLEKIYNDAMNCSVDWRTANIDKALPILNNLINDRYPWLSTRAQSNLRYAFIMTWK